MSGLYSEIQSDVQSNSMFKLLPKKSLNGLGPKYIADMFDAYDVIVTSSQWIKLCAQTYCRCLCTNICYLTDGDLPGLTPTSSPVEHRQEAVTTQRRDDDGDEGDDEEGKSWHCEH